MVKQGPTFIRLNCAPCEQSKHQLDLDHLLYADFRPNQCPKQPIKDSKMSDAESEGDSIIVGPWTQAGRNLDHYFGSLVRKPSLLSRTIVFLFFIFVGNILGPLRWPGDGELIRRSPC
jgi:hypothetical protein